MFRLRLLLFGLIVLIGGGLKDGIQPCSAYTLCHNVGERCYSSFQCGLSCICYKGSHEIYGICVPGD